MKKGLPYAQRNETRVLGVMRRLFAVISTAAVVSATMATGAGAEPVDPVEDSIPQSADLITTSVSVNPASTTEWEIRHTVSNRGGEAAPTFRVTFYEKGTTLIANRSISGLAGNTSKSEVFRIPRRNCYIPIRITVDSTNAVGEGVESNNVRWVAGIGSGCPGDRDGDGLEDATEDAIASRYFPHVWFDSGENTGCTAPASATTNGTALARVRPHPSDRTKIAVQYVILYQRDCGDFGDGGHTGDVEPFSITVALNSACPTGYGVSYLKTIAHANTSVEHIDERTIGNSCTWGRLAGGDPRLARIYAAENKHGNYASDSSCDSGGFSSSDNCSESFTRNFNVYNVGEDNGRRIDELSNYQFPGEYAWSNVGFRGGIGGDGVPPIRDKWVQDRLLARA